MIQRSHRNGAGSGFTLIELLVVMTIITIMVSIGFSRFGGATPAVTTTLPVVEARIDVARSAATGGQTRARVVIHNDDSDTENPDRYLRFIAIAEEEKDAGGAGTGIWKSIGSDGYLMKGVFFDSAASENAAAAVEASNPPPEGSTVTGFGRWEEGSIEFTGKPEGPQPCYYIEFNSEGICIQEGSAAPGAAVVISRGVLAGDGDVIFDDSDKVGFVILRNGGTMHIRDTAELIN